MLLDNPCMSPPDGGGEVHFATAKGRRSLLATATYAKHVGAAFRSTGRTVSSK